MVLRVLLPDLRADALTTHLLLCGCCTSTKGLRRGRRFDCASRCRDKLSSFSVWGGLSGHARAHACVRLRARVRSELLPPAHSTQTRCSLPSSAPSPSRARARACAHMHARSHTIPCRVGGRDVRSVARPHSWQWSCAPLPPPSSPAPP